MDKTYHISICTVCMNRLYHLKETLPKNISDNLSYGPLEHVLLDYNSGDDMEKWVQENLAMYISDGRLKYYRTPDPAQFNMAHSKNMVANLAQGDIVCIVDADNYTGKDYAVYVNNFFNRYPESFLTTIAKRKIKHGADILGRVCFWKKDFLAIQGFDEFMNNYGFDDHDFANRLSLAGRQRKMISHRKHLKAIEHSKDERVANHQVSRHFENLFIHHISYTISEFLYLFAGNRFSLGMVKNNHAEAAMDLENLLKPKKYQYDETLGTDDWIQGKWAIENQQLVLSLDKGDTIVFEKTAPDRLLWKSSGKTYFKVTSQKMITDLLFFHTVIRNRNKMNTNYKLKKTIVNNNHFGAGKVYKNFDNRLPIQI